MSHPRVRIGVSEWGSGRHLPGPDQLVTQLAGEGAGVAEEPVEYEHPAEVPMELVLGREPNPGEYLLKGQLRGPITGPRTEEELLSLQALGRAQLAEEQEAQ